MTPSAEPFPQSLRDAYRRRLLAARAGLGAEGIAELQRHIELWLVASRDEALFEQSPEAELAALETAIDGIRAALDAAPIDWRSIS